MRLPHILAGLDAGQLVGVTARTMQIGAGLVTMILVSVCWDARTQGYFYTFGSLIALQVLAEVGLGTVLIQFVSHEMAYVRWNGNTLEGATKSLLRIYDIFEFAIKWFGIGAVILVGILLLVGEIFFSNTKQTDSPEGLWSAWLLLVIATAISLFTTAIFNILEGTGKVAEVGCIRLIQQLIGAISAWGAILLGIGLAALAIQAIVVAVVGLLYVCTKYSAWKVLRTIPNSGEPLNWRGEILPFQWRIAVSWLSGYFTYQAFTPALFIMTGPEAAGKMGMSMQIFSALSSISIILITARSPAFGRLVSSGDRNTLDLLFRTSLVQSVSLLALLLALLGLGLSVAIALGFEAIFRLLPVCELGTLAAAMVGSHLVTAQATYLRAHKCEPFMKLALLNASLMTLISIWSIPHFGTSGATWTYATVTLLVSLPLGNLIFRRFRLEQALPRTTT